MQALVIIGLIMFTIPGFTIIAAYISKIKILSQPRARTWARARARLLGMWSSQTKLIVGQVGTNRSDLHETTCNFIKYRPKNTAI